MQRPTLLLSHYPNQLLKYLQYYLIYPLHVVVVERNYDDADVVAPVVAVVQAMIAEPVVLSLKPWTPTVLPVVADA